MLSGNDLSFLSLDKDEVVTALEELDVTRRIDTGATQTSLGTHPRYGKSAIVTDLCEGSGIIIYIKSPL